MQLETKLDHKAVTDPAVYCTAALGPCIFAHDNSPSEAANIVMVTTVDKSGRAIFDCDCRVMESCSHAEAGMHAPYHGSLQGSAPSCCLHADTNMSDPLLRMSLLKAAEMRAKSCHMPAISTHESNATSDNTRWTIFMLQCPIHAMLSADQALIGGQSNKLGHLACVSCQTTCRSQVQ